MDPTDRSRFHATLLGYAGACTSLAEFRLQILDDLRRVIGSDGALLRPGDRWVGSRVLSLDEGSRFTDLYVGNAPRFGPELRRWCALSRGSQAFIDSEVYSDLQQDRMAVYGEVLRPAGIRCILACPLTVGDATAGLVFLVRRRSAARFPTAAAAAATRLLPALALADRFLETAFTHGRPAAEARPVTGTEGAFETLGPREQQVAALLAHGLQSKEIAALLESSPHTVHAQTQRIFDKLGLRGRTQVALLAQQLGLVDHAAAASVDPMLASFGALLRRTLARRFGDVAPAAGGGPSRSPVRPPAGGRFATLGRRERQVAELVARGLSSRAIAAILGTSFHTVRAQTRRIFAKLGVQGRTGVALLVAGASSEERGPLAAIAHLGD